jgi:hypothetical protein
MTIQPVAGFFTFLSADKKLKIEYLRAICARHVFLKKETSVA